MFQTLPEGRHIEPAYSSAHSQEPETRSLTVPKQGLRRVTAEEIIPMNDDDDFIDF